MDLSEIAEKHTDSSRRSRWIGIYVGVLAALLAVCSLGGDNATKDAMRANVDATNTWAFFQAKNVRRAAYMIAADDLELTLSANPGMPAEARAAMEAKIKAYQETIERFKSERTTNEGLDELFAKGKQIEREREIAFEKDPYFDASQALLQIAIVLASVALIAETSVLLWFSALLAAVGTVLMVNGFTLMMKLPFLG